MYLVFFSLCLEQRRSLSLSLSLSLLQISGRSYRPLFLLGSSLFISSLYMCLLIKKIKNAPGIQGRLKKVETVAGFFIEKERLI